jgi:Flp pilus assembly pilin Flp
MTPSVPVQSFPDPDELDIGHGPKTTLRSNEMTKIKNFINDESGLETIEYAIVAAIVAAVALLIYGAGWGGSVQNTLKNAAAKSTTATL